MICDYGIFFAFIAHMENEGGVERTMSTFEITMKEVGLKTKVLILVSEYANRSMSASQLRCLFDGMTRDNFERSDVLEELNAELLCAGYPQDEVKAFIHSLTTIEKPRPSSQAHKTITRRGTLVLSFEDAPTTTPPKGANVERTTIDPVPGKVSFSGFGHSDVIYPE